ncbi:chaperonin 10-like protein [Kalaharituber pfeilii]|nr:chaperonin 10-like protein [Kalaharituber pfeilii]
MAYLDRTHTSVASPDPRQHHPSAHPPPSLSPSTIPILSSVLTAPKTLSLEPRLLPPPPPGFLQVRILSTTLCGSDLHYWRHFRNGSIVPKQPLILGHESCAVVTAIGPPDDTPTTAALTSTSNGHSISDFAVGDLVALEVGVPCGVCALCLPPDKGGLGRYNICPNLRFRSSGKEPAPSAGGLLEGTLQGGLNHPAAWCRKLPPGFNPHLASLLEPLSVALHAISRALPLPALPSPSAVLVLGAGPVGLLIAACLRRLLPPSPPRPKIVICDVVHSRLEAAVHELGWADSSILLSTALLSLAPPDLTAYIHKRLATTIGPSTRIEAVFECTGAPSSLSLSFHLPSAGGKVLILTIPPAESTVPLGMATLREVDILGVFRYGRGDYQRAIDVVREGKIRGIEKLVTHVFEGLSEVPRAMETLEKGIDDMGRGVVKVVVQGSEADFGDGCLKEGIWESQGQAQTKVQEEAAV